MIINVARIRSYQSLMNYIDGQKIRLGDKVGLGEAEGIVVCSVDTGEYADEYPPDPWGTYLKTGVLINFPQFGLIHYQTPESELRLLERAAQSPVCE